MTKISRDEDRAVAPFLRPGSGYCFGDGDGLGLGADVGGRHLEQLPCLLLRRFRVARDDDVVGYFVSAAALSDLRRGAFMA